MSVSFCPWGKQWIQHPRRNHHINSLKNKQTVNFTNHISSDSKQDRPINCKLETLKTCFVIFVDVSPTFNTIKPHLLLYQLRNNCFMDQYIVLCLTVSFLIEPNIIMFKIYKPLPLLPIMVLLKVVFYQQFFSLIYKELIYIGITALWFVCFTKRIYETNQCWPIASI